MKAKLPTIDIAGLKERFNTFYHKRFQSADEKQLQDYLEVERERPDDMYVKQKIAELYYRMDRIDEAVAKYAAVAQSHEKSDFILKAIKGYKAILKVRPTLVDVNIKLGQLFLKVGLTVEAANQYRIAINHYAAAGDKEKTVTLTQLLVKIDPSNANRHKLAEIYQAYGLIEEALKQYELLAKDYRNKKIYDRLLNVYELILPHKPGNKAILKDVCILYMREQKPERALAIMDRYKVAEEDEVFTGLADKARLMVDAMRRQKKK
jgi:tetratricopeptide (TPR) repeat protein